jgi:hypothetical protein
MKRYTLWSASILCLFASAVSYGQSSTIVFHFNKQSGLNNTCWSPVKEGNNNGNLLACRINLPDNVKGSIANVVFSCEGATPCQYTHECPDNGSCGGHPYKTEPHNLPVDKPRVINWYGWTNDGNNATLSFTVTVVN